MYIISLVDKQSKTDLKYKLLIIQTTSIVIITIKEIALQKKY